MVAVFSSDPEKAPGAFVISDDEVVVGVGFSTNSGSLSVAGAMCPLV